jgi:hypothetical protein
MVNLAGLPILVRSGGQNAAAFRTLTDAEGWVAERQDRYPEAIYTALQFDGASTRLWTWDRAQKVWCK